MWFWIEGARVLSSSTGLALSLFFMTGAGVGVQEEADVFRGNKSLRN